MLTLGFFTPIWWQHVAVVAAYAIFVAAGLAWVRTWKDPVRVRRIEITIAIVGLAFSGVVNWWWLRPGKFTWEESIPVQMCDLAGLISPLALLTKARWLRTLLHFWGLGLCSQWVCTPVTQVGPQHFDFWVSFMLHASILGGAAWDVVIGGYRPRRDWSDWRLAIVGGVIYTALMIPLNIALHANYGYLGASRPEAITIVDALGPWPWRIGWIAVLATVAMTLIQFCWIGAARMGFVAPLPTRSEPAGKRERTRAGRVS